jgi:splicing factor 3A subunit 3|tara:strand:- start:633 stop:794 length:162 start_codon:yes stop_codon:yes gene_type:complete
VTRIEEATKLWARLQRELKEDKFDPERDMEFEDTEGNVFDKRTYENLAKQGLL